MKKFQWLIAVTAVLIFFASCKNAGKSDLIIPKDADFVVHISGSSIFSKLSWEDIKKSEFFRMAYDSTKDDFKKRLMDNPENSGIDIKSDFAFFSRKTGNNNIGTFQGKLKDAAAFEAFTKQMEKDAKIEKSGDLSYVKQDNNSIVTWNKDHFYVVSGMPEPPSMANFDDTTAMMNEDVYDAPMKDISDSLLIHSKELIAYDKSNLLTEDERFSDLMKEKGDLHLWVNSGKAYAELKNNPMGMMKAGDLFKDLISASTINFENGKIDMKSKQYMSKDMQQIIESNKPVNVNADLINRIPSQNVVAVFAMNIPTEGLRAFLKVSGMDGLANMMLTKYGLNIEQLTNAYKGEMIMAVSDLTVKEVEHKFEGQDLGYKSKEPDWKFLMAMAVNDRPTFEKAWNLIKTEVLKEKDSAKMAYRINDQWFAAGNSPDYLDQFLGGTTKNNFDFTSSISGHPFGAYIDLRKLIPMTKSFMMGAPGQPLVDSTWENVVMTGGEFSKGALLSHMEINMVDKNTNSLKQIYNYISTMFRGFVVNDRVRMRDQVDIQTLPDTSASAAPF